MQPDGFEKELGNVAIPHGSGRIIFHNSLAVHEVLIRR
jgi:hypothetical protein